MEAGPFHLFRKLRKLLEDWKKIYDTVQEVDPEPGIRQGSCRDNVQVMETAVKCADDDVVMVSMKQVMQRQNTICRKIRSLTQRKAHSMHCCAPTVIKFSSSISAV